MNTNPNLIPTKINVHSNQFPSTWKKKLNLEF